MKKIFISFLLVLIFCITNLSYSKNKKVEVGIDEHLGKYIPTDVFFYDESGNKVLLKDLITTPTVFAFVYYQCPGLCTPLMSEIADVVGKINMIPNKDYRIITLSMDEHETPKIATEKKKTFLKMINGKFPETGWRFLTGDSVNIKKLADAMGFYFQRQGKNFLHTGALIFLSPKEKITRYLFPDYKEGHGYSILPFNMKMALIEASEGKASPTITQVLQYCYSYNPKAKTYMINITRVSGAGILILAAIFVGYLNFKPKKKKLKEG